MILYALFLINEILCAGISYTRLIRLGMKSNKNLVKEIIAGFKNVFKIFSYFLVKDRNEKKSGEEEALINSLGKIGEFFAGLICGMVIFFVLPAVSVMMVYGMKGIFGKAAAAFLLVCIQNVMIFKEMSRKRREIANLVSGFREANRSLDHWNGNRAINSRRRLGGRTFGIILCLIICYLAMLYGSNKIFAAAHGMGKYNKILCVFCIIILFLMDLPEKLRKKKQYAEAKREIVVSGERLQEYENDIKKMCVTLGIDDVMIREDVGGILAEAIVQKDERPGIFIDVNAIGLVSGKAGCQENEAVKMFTAHELAHIFYKDSGSKNRGIRKVSLLYFVVLIMIFASASLLSSVLILPFIICLLGLTCIIISSVCFDDRYWGQLMELRADKLSMQISGVSINTYKAIYKELEVLDTGDLGSTGRFYRLYEKYMDSQSYPAFSRRIQSLEQKPAWGLYYYVWLCMVIIKGLIRKEGWYGKS